MELSDLALGGTGLQAASLYLSVWPPSSSPCPHSALITATLSLLPALAKHLSFRICPSTPRAVFFPKPPFFAQEAPLHTFPHFPYFQLSKTAVFTWMITPSLCLALAPPYSTFPSTSGSRTQKVSSLARRCRHRAQRYEGLDPSGPAIRGQNKERTQGIWSSLPLNLTTSVDGPSFSNVYQESLQRRGSSFLSFRNVKVANYHRRKMLTWSQSVVVPALLLTV